MTNGRRERKVKGTDTVDNKVTGEKQRVVNVVMEKTPPKRNPGADGINISSMKTSKPEFSHKYPKFIDNLHQDNLVKDMQKQREKNIKERNKK